MAATNKTLTTTVDMIELASSIAAEAMNDCGVVNFDHLFDAVNDALDTFIDEVKLSDAQHRDLCRCSRSLVLALVALSMARQTTAAVAESKRLISEYDRTLRLWILARPRD